MKPVRLLCYVFNSLFFWTWPYTTFNSIPIILNLLANRDIALIYSTTTAPLFSPLMFAGFHNQSRLLCQGETNNENTFPGDSYELSKFIL